jgi:cysteinyl-tRNA synthetase
VRRFTVYDSRTREARVFAPIHPPRVGMYVCGLTPYAPAHVGHARTFVFFDVVARALRRWGYRLFYVQNVTNLDDKMIARAAEERVEPLALGERQFAGYLAAMERLGVRSVNYYPFATDYLPEIIAQVRDLVAKGFAYRADDGSVYYEVAKFPGYGRLSGQRLEALRPGARLEVDPHKRAPEDFVIWKAAAPGEPSWPSPWGPGRPGWHVEDTAITVRLLGARYDLHGAGVDLIFPHHEAEVALAESATGEAPLVNYWMHAGMLQFSGEKMSKSVGNVVGLDDLLERWGPGPLRFCFVNVQYRGPLDFDGDSTLAEANEAYLRLGRPLGRIDELLARDGPDRAGEEPPAALGEEATELVERLDTTLANDFDTRGAVALLFGWTRRLLERPDALDGLSGPALERLRTPYAWATEVLGLFEDRPTAAGGREGQVVEVALAARARARGRGDFAEADRIRDDLARAGVVVEDGAHGTRWRPGPPPA